MMSLVKQTSQNFNKPISNGKERNLVCQGDIQKIINDLQEISEIK